MASLSLPRVLQMKKNSLDAEREQFEKFQTLAIQKAINTIETPVKEKHVRSTIIGTFQEQSAVTYWMVATRLPLQENRIVVWKFCHVTHKLLREGHPACLVDSQRHLGMIRNLGKLWVHLREGYGRLVSVYCFLLVSKLQFHARNPRFPGNMNLTSEELDAIAENDVNNYFQLCVELFDYMDEILTLQEAVFDSLGNARANSMTASGQCRLAALIPCAQDSSHIYDCNVRLLFRLHAALPPDTLTGHRERFRQQFKKLSSFYKHASSLQYYRNLLTLPLLPSNPPNFLQQSEFGAYVRPVVSVPEPPDEPDTTALIDTSDTQSQFTPEQEFFDTPTTPSPQPDQLGERDRLIEHLQTELKRMRSEVSQMVQERNSMLNSMREHCTKLENELQTTKSELDEEKQKADTLLTQTPEIQKKLSETEEKAKVTDDKFQKLKGAYTQLREEHIKLIRQKAEVDKTAASLRAATAEHESAKMSLQQQLNDKIKDVELLQQSASSSEEIEAYKNEIASLRSDIEQSRQQEVQLETLKANMEALQIEHNTAKTEAEEKLNLVNSELKEVKDELTKVIEDRDLKESEFEKVKNELAGLREKSGEEYKKAVQEKESAQLELASLTQKYHQEKQERDGHVGDLEAEVEILKQKLNETEHKLEEDKEIQLQLIRENQETYDSLLQERDAEVTNTRNEINVLKEELNKINAEHEAKEKQYNEKLQELNSKLETLSTDKDSIYSQIEIIKEENKNVVVHLENEIQNLGDQLKIELNKVENLQKELNDKINEISQLNEDKNNLENRLQTEKALLEALSQDISSYTEHSKNEVNQKNIRIDELNDKIKQNNEILSKENEIKVNLLKELEAMKLNLEVKENTITELQLNINETNKVIENMKTDLNNSNKDHELQITLLQDKLQNKTASKDEIINNLKNSISEKDERVINLSVEVKKLTEELERVNEEMMEQAAELEIGQNELVNLKAEHDALMNDNERNLTMKNHELRTLNEQIHKLTEEKQEILKQKESLVLESITAKQAYEDKINSLVNEVDKTREDIYKLTIQLSEVQASKEDTINELTSKLNENKESWTEQISMKDILLVQNKREIEDLNELLNSVNKERAEESLSYENDKKSLESRLNHVEKEKINAECELQDLLQHNTVLEENVVALKTQLEEAKQEVEKQRSILISCASKTALQVTSDALAALESGSPMENNKAAADLAARTLDELAACTQVNGKEESIARNAILVAHNTAQLSFYVTDVSNATTDLTVAEKMLTECRTMLASTKQCLESLASGSACDTSVTRDTSAKVRAVSRTALEADKSHAAARNVDDELADMDRAIEMAATQIEELLNASRSSDSGLKLEVNGAILDACTGLMGAVREVVRQSRGAQGALGDPRARRHVYRRNPQWSEGLISASKAVVFAAKLLVSSADDTVSGAGRAENVSAAAHEVAASSAQLVSACRSRAPPGPAVQGLVAASRTLAGHTAAVVAAVRHAASLTNEQEALDTSALTLTATRRLEMESKVRSLELETALDAERARLAALRKRHYQLAQIEENGNMTNGKKE